MSRAVRTPPEWTLVLGLFALALALRVLCVFELSHDAVFWYPLIDEKSYLDLARRLVRGLQLSRESFWQPPGIVFVLAAVGRLTGQGVFLWARIVQAVVSAATCVLVRDVGGAYFSRRIAWAAALVTALNGVLIHSATELLPATWIAFFNVAALACLWRARARGAPGWALATGLSLGVSTIFQPGALVLAPVAVASLWRAARGVRRALCLAVLAVGIAAPIAPVTIRNYRLDHAVVLVSTNGGINFYIGNEPTYPRLFELRPGPMWQLYLTSPTQSGIQSSIESDRYFYRKGFEFIAHSPVRAAALFARKLYLFFNGREIPRNTDVYLVRKRSWILRALVWPPPLALPAGLIMPAALVGLAWALGARRRQRVPAAFAILQALVVCAFFVSGRYRLTALPLYALFAAQGGAWLLAQLRAGGRRAALAVMLAAVLLLACNLPTREAAQDLRDEELVQRWQASLEVPWALPDDADFRRAIEIELELGRREEAISRLVSDYLPRRPHDARARALLRRLTGDAVRPPPRPSSAPH